MRSQRCILVATSSDYQSSAGVRSRRTSGCHYRGVGLLACGKGFTPTLLYPISSTCDDPQENMRDYIDGNWVFPPADEKHIVAPDGGEDQIHQVKRRVALICPLRWAYHFRTLPKLH